jgi:tetratricopeptide (TPR) repeat protein
MRLRIWGCAVLALACGVVAAAPPRARLREPGIGTLEIESSFAPAGRGSPAGAATTIVLTLAFPDTLAATDTRAILASMGPGMGKPLLPRGKLRPEEEFFLKGLSALAGGNPFTAAENWEKMRGRPTEALAGSLRVNVGALHVLRGEPALAESLWVAEWRYGVAAEAAWRNLLALQMAFGRYGRAGALVDAMLAQRPGQRTALQAKAALLRQFRPEAEWEEFVRTRALASPDMQLVYGELLLERGQYAEAVRYLDRGLAELPGSGRGWRLLAEAQYKLGYYYFAIDCLQNAGRAGYHPAEFYELYARVLQACCTGDADPRQGRARAAAEDLLEAGLPKDVHRRSMAQLLYHMYCQNSKPDAARALERDLWFHFEGPDRDVPDLGDPNWKNAGLEARELPVKFGLYAFPWVMELKRTDVFRAVL